MRCFEGRMFDMQRGAWVACQRCSGSGRVVVYLYLSQSAVHGSPARDPLRAGVLLPGLRFFRVAGWGWVVENRDRVAECAHPFEKSTPGFKDASIHGLPS
jgi:hypothetical protein